MITPKSDHQIDLECIEFVVTSVYKLVETSLHATPYSIWVFHDLALMYLCSLYHPTQELQLIHYFFVTQWEGEITAQEADSIVWYPLNLAPVGITADGVALKEVERVGMFLQNFVREALTATSTKA